MKKESDYEYLGELLRVAQMGDRTAFAELYAATYTRAYGYAYRYLRDEDAAKVALRRIYGRVLREIQSLRTPELIMVWLNRICFLECYEIKTGADAADMNECNIEIGAASYSINQLFRLPLTESQALIQHYYLRLPVSENAWNLDVSKTTLKRNLRIGRLHLRKLLGRR